MTCDKAAEFGGLDSDKQRQGVQPGARMPVTRGTRAVWIELGILNFTQILDQGLVSSSASGRGGQLRIGTRLPLCARVTFS